LAVAISTQAALAEGDAASAAEQAALSARRGIDYRLLRLDGTQVKWGAPQLGTGAKVRYALLPVAMDFGKTRNCRGLKPLDELLASSGIDQAKAASEIAAAFAMWERAANINFQRVEHPAVADIVIGAQAAPTGRAFTEVIHERGASVSALPGMLSPPDARAPAGLIRRIEKALICLNPEQPWKVGFGGDVEVYDLRYTIAHEIGHAIGLDHPGPSGQLMGFAYEEQFRVLQPGDLAGAIALYGRRGLPVAKKAAPAPADVPADPRGTALQ
jgi:hypothetical protein